MVSPVAASVGNSGHSQLSPLHMQRGCFPPGAPQMSPNQLELGSSSPPQPVCGENLGTAPNIPEVETSFILYPLICRSVVWVGGCWRRSCSTITGSRRPSNNACGDLGWAVGTLCQSPPQQDPLGGTLLSREWQAMVPGGSPCLQVRTVLGMLHLGCRERHAPQRKH